MASARKKVPTHAQEEDDDYWNESSSKFKKFNFNDEEDEYDTIDMIRWDGSTATPIKNSKPNTPAAHATKSQPISTPQSHPSASSVRHTATSSRVGSARAYPSSRKAPEHFPSPASLPKSSSPATHAPISIKPNGASDDRSISDVVSAHDRKALTATDLAKLEAEIHSLKRQLHQAKRERAAAPSIEDTLRRLMVGDSYVLELYKSKEDKAKLLDSAIDRFDGNAILAATLFMRDTLKRDLFSKELMSRPVAVDHYCTYLRSAGEVDELHETLSVLGRTEEAAMLKYKQCLLGTAASSPEIRCSGLQDCIKYYFDSDKRLSHETSQIIEQMSLMRRQSVVEQADKLAEKEGQVAVFKSHPRKDSIVHKSVITTLYYCCYYHWGEAAGLLSSPTSIMNEHKVGRKQFQYIALAALCRMRRWRDMEQMLTAPRSMFRSARFSAVIGFDKVVDVLSKNLAPNDAISKYCAEIENSEKRLEISTKLSCHKVAIDTMVHHRNRQQLQAYSNQIPESNHYMKEYLKTQLKSPDVKWKN